MKGYGKIQYIREYQSSKQNRKHKEIAKVRHQRQHPKSRGAKDHIKKTVVQEKEQAMPKITKSLCEVHNQSFRTFEELNRHIRDKHIELTCEICSRNFPNETAIRLHRKANHVSKEK